MIRVKMYFNPGDSLEENPESFQEWKKFRTTIEKAGFKMEKWTEGSESLEAQFIYIERGENGSGS